MSAPQLLKGGRLHYLAGDLLAEVGPPRELAIPTGERSIPALDKPSLSPSRWQVTMAILAGKKAQDTKGYATDFVFMMKQHGRNQASRSEGRGECRWHQSRGLS
jgi:hypothetical protein